VPLALQGTLPVATYAQSNLPEAKEDLLIQVRQMYAHDPQLQVLWASALEARGMAGTVKDGTPKRQDSAALGKIAASFLARADGPRIAMIETSG
jgi:hypothetical protein